MGRYPNPLNYIMSYLLVIKQYTAFYFIGQGDINETEIVA